MHTNTDTHIQSVINHPARSHTPLFLLARGSVRFSLFSTVSGAYTLYYIVYTVVFFIIIIIYSETHGGEDFNFSILFLFGSKTNKYALALAHAAHTSRVLISIPTPRVAALAALQRIVGRTTNTTVTTITTTTATTTMMDCVWGLYYIQATPTPRVLSLAPAPKTANLSLRFFFFASTVSAAVVATEL